MYLSLYTDKFLRVWNDDKFEGTYNIFHYHLQNKIMLADPSHNYFPLGQNYGGVLKVKPYSPFNKRKQIIFYYK